MKKILVSLATVGALSALVTGASFALFTAEAVNENNTFSAGTVTFDNMTGFTCDINTDTTNMAPGDSGTCNVSVTYSGSLDAWVGVSYEAVGDLFMGATPMTVAVNGTWDGSFYVLGQMTDGDTATATITYNFPLAADNSYQGASGAIDLTFKAVQARNNTNGTNDGPISWN